jgi:3,4-dihydroxy 2-butanone 4-phosphate synthase / GTP cyclohydrolase II
MMQIKQAFKAFKKRGIGILTEYQHEEECKNKESLRSIFVLPAQDMSSETVNFLLNLTGGIFFVAVSKSRADDFLLSPVSRALTKHGSKHATPDLSILVSVEARSGVTTGISASDRAKTISILGQKEPHPRSLISPGHIFPVCIKEGGVLIKHDLPEGAHDIVKLTGYTDAALYIDIINMDGTIPGKSEVFALAKKYDVPLFTLSDLLAYRLETEPLVSLVTCSKMPTKQAGMLDAFIFTSKIDASEHLALVKGGIVCCDKVLKLVTKKNEKPVLTRVQSENIFSDVFGGGYQSTRAQILRSLQEIEKRGEGVMLYLKNNYQGQLTNMFEKISLLNEIRDSSRKGISTQSEFMPQDIALSSRHALMKEYGLGAQVLRSLGLQKIELLTTNKLNAYTKISGFQSFGLEITREIYIGPE